MCERTKNQFNHKNSLDTRSKCVKLTAPNNRNEWENVQVECTCYDSHPANCSSDAHPITVIWPCWWHFESSIKFFFFGKYFFSRLFFRKNFHLKNLFFSKTIAIKLHSMAKFSKIYYASNWTGCKRWFIDQLTHDDALHASNWCIGHTTSELWQWNHRQLIVFRKWTNTNEDSNSCAPNGNGHEIG